MHLPRPTLLRILTAIQNAPEYAPVDIMTFAGFCTEPGELADYVWSKFGRLGADQKARVLRLAKEAL
jgi:hypothetical protein